MKDIKINFPSRKFTYDYPTKTTQWEWQSEWMNYSAMQTTAKFKENDLVRHGTNRARVRECHGKNVLGQDEYYIEYCDPKLGGAYVIEEELSEIDLSTPPEVPKKADKKCDHKNVYKNIISSSLEFWVCRDCKEEVPEPNKFLTQAEIDELFNKMGPWGS